MTNTDNTTTDKCRAQVRLGSYTYAARNTTRQCGNAARANGFCHLHQPVEITAEQRANWEAARAALLAQLAEGDR